MSTRGQLWILPRAGTTQRSASGVIDFNGRIPIARCAKCLTCHLSVGTIGPKGLDSLAIVNAVVES